MLSIVTPLNLGNSLISDCVARVIVAWNGRMPRVVRWRVSASVAVAWREGEV